MVNTRGAMHCPGFEFELNKLDEELQVLLAAKKIDKASIFSKLTKEKPESAGARRDFENLLKLLAVDPGVHGTWAEDLVRLHAVAHGLAPEVAQRLGALTGHEVSADIVSLQRSRHEKAEAQALKRLALHSLAH